ncbi:MAG: hypothetical protein HN742_00070 [Lentisphaerae bacterium]|jgi:hypothetical protein|nr:hypothetical protein [Lentisphaerota bacterium]MBT4819321.1 hypothetical protein [Lentisphaerota bacterium]MBT5608077.1 hypothetical protein [Lentisphaerota bacterium]MBT7057597.1 hypothetical protein [Lentisphaerota bacterium]MBT7840224.1 hypothetical protein [Lentisphaerota bacterium]
MFDRHPHHPPMPGEAPPPPHHGPPPPPHHGPHDGPPPPPHFVHHGHSELTEEELGILEGLIAEPEAVRSFSRIFAYAPPEIGAVLTVLLQSHRALAAKCSQIESRIEAIGMSAGEEQAEDSEGGISQ